MIKTEIIQKFASDKPLGFTRYGGTMRYYLNVLDVSRADWLKTLDYCVGRSWVEFTGQTDAAGKVYSWRGQRTAPATRRDDELDRQEEVANS